MLQHDTSVLSAQLHHFRQARQRGSGSGSDLSNPSSGASSKDVSPALNSTSQSNGVDPSHLSLAGPSPSPDAGTLLLPDKLARPGEYHSTPSSSPQAYHPSSRSLPSSPTKPFQQPATGAAVSPSSASLALLAVSPQTSPVSSTSSLLSASAGEASRLLHEGMSAQPRYPSVGRISPMAPITATTEPDATSEPTQPAALEVGEGGDEADKPVALSTRSLPVGSSSVSGSSLPRAVPPFQRSYSTSSTGAVPRGIALRSVAARSALLSPLTSRSQSPAPPTHRIGQARSLSSASHSPSSAGSSSSRPLPTYDGLTPLTTIRTLQPLLTEESTAASQRVDSSSSSTSSSSASSSSSLSSTTLTPASAMRVLFTGQSAASGGVQPAPTLRRLTAGKHTPDTSPEISPAKAPRSGSLTGRARHLSLTSPITATPPADDEPLGPPGLHRASTTLLEGEISRSSSGVSGSASSSVSDLFAVPGSTPGDSILNGEESDSDDDTQETADTATVATAEPPAVPIQGAFFHRLVSLLPWSTSPTFLSHLETAYAVLITLSLFYALFVDPIRLALLPASLDAFLAGVLLLIFVLLLLEFAFFLTSNPSYAWSLEAVLDCCALVSLLPQVAAMWYEIELTRIQSALMMMMRAGILVRLVGVLRLIPITSIFSVGRLRELRRRWRRWERRQRLLSWQKGDEQDDRSINLLRPVEPVDQEDDDALSTTHEPADDSAGSDGLSSALYPTHASRIGQSLSDYTAHRVVLGVLFVLLLYNYFHAHTVHTVHPYAVHHLESMMQGAMNSSTSSIQQTVQDYQTKYRQDLLLLAFNNVTLVDHSELLRALRPHEKLHVQTEHFDCWINVRQWSQQFALFDFWSLLLVLLLLPVLLRLIYDDVHAVISPIERMGKFVTSLAADPMSDLSAADPTLSSSLASLLPSITAASNVLSASGPGLTLGSALGSPRGDSDDRSSLCSTKAAPAVSSSFSLDSFFVELTLQRLAVLLQLVFGSAGANIIANNIRGDYLEVVTPGRKVYAIFAFMGVEGWDAMMETLQVEMSELMNATAELVHSVCVLFGGEVNKNIGNAFLLVWKLEAESRTGKDGDGDGREKGDGTDLAMVRSVRKSSGGVLADQLQRRPAHSEDRLQPLHPSTSFPRSLASHLPVRGTFDDTVLPRGVAALPPPPASRRTVSHAGIPAVPRSPQLRKRRPELAAPPRGRASTGEGVVEHKEPLSPDEVDSPPPVHCDVDERRKEEREHGRRNSLLRSLMSLNRKDLGSIFSRSTLHMFSTTSPTADEAKERRTTATTSDEQARKVGETKQEAEHATAAMEAKHDGADGDHLVPPAAVLSHSPQSPTRSQHRSPPSPSGSFYSRTHPTPPLAQPASGRKQHGWKINASNHRLAEQALSSFLLTLLQLSTSPSLLKWRQHPLLAAHHLSLQFGIGLHVGWAIEGAIGSSHKIDASYLSPNVNLSSRLSVLCHHYHLPLLFSSAFHSLLGPDVQKRCRKVDVVMVKGSRKPIGIYTFDIDFGDVTEMERGRREDRERDGRAIDGDDTAQHDGQSDTAAAAGGVTHHASFDERMRRKQVVEIEEIMRQLKKAVKRSDKPAARPDDTEDAAGPEAVLSGEEGEGDEEEDGGDRRGRGSSHRRASAPDVASGLHRSSSSSSLSSHSPLLPSLGELLSSLQSHLPPPFIPLYNAACSCYIDGDWRSAGRLLVRVLTMRSGDGPSQLLLKVMAKEGFRAPKGWKGYRVLTKK